MGWKSAFFALFHAIHSLGPSRRGLISLGDLGGMDRQCGWCDTDDAGD